MKTIGVVGAGTMGSGIAQVLAQKGFGVVMQDISQQALERGLAAIDRQLARSVSKGRMTETEKQEVLDRLKTTVSVSEFSDCELVIEAASENMDIKKEIFKQLDQACRPTTILATNTSSLSISEIAQVTSRPDKVIGMHFFNPVPVMKLVEVIRGLATGADTVAAVMKLAEELGKEPVEVREAPGFVVNRLLIPMINEAVGVLADGVASAEDIDKAMKLGANHPIGPLALADLIGLDVCLAIMEVLHSEFGDDKYRPHPLLRKMVRGGLLGRKSGRGFYCYN